MLSALRVKLGYISFDKRDRNGHVGMYLHCLDRGLDGWWLDRVRTVHSNHHLMMTVTWCLKSLSTITKNKIKEKKIFKSILRWENAASSQGIHCLQKQFSHFSLGISKSHSPMYLKWTSQNLTSFAKLSLSLPLESSFFFYPHANMTCLLSRQKLFALTLLEKRYRTGGNRTRFDPHLSWNTCICYCHSLLPLLQDWQLQVSGGMGFSVLVKRLIV